MPIEKQEHHGAEGLRQAGEREARRVFARWFTRLAAGGFFGLIAWVYLELAHEPWLAALCAFCAGAAMACCRGPEDVSPGAP
jgi:hypothetical protein